MKIFLIVFEIFHWLLKFTWLLTWNYFICSLKETNIQHPVHLCAINYLFLITSRNWRFWCIPSLIDFVSFLLRSISFERCPSNKLRGVFGLVSDKSPSYPWFKKALCWTRQKAAFLSADSISPAHFFPSFLLAPRLLSLSLARYVYTT